MDEMEWRPSKPERRGTGRRHYDGDLGERVARIDERLGSLETSLHKTDEAIIRVHERIDEINSSVTTCMSAMRSQISDAVEDMDRRIDAHVRDEEKLMSAKFDAVLERLDRVAEEGKTRGEAASHRQEILVKVLAGIAAIAAPVVGYIGAKFFDSLPKVILLMDKLESLK